MPVTINNIIETLLNPAGRFISLGDIAPRQDREGDPLFTYNGKTADFRIHWQQQDYVLKVAVSRQSNPDFSFAPLESVFREVPRDYLVDYRFLPTEMLVFDEAGNGHFLDIVLMQLPEGLSLDRFLARVCDAEDYALLDRLRREFTHRCAWLLRNPVVHRRIRPENIVVTADGTPVLINYERMIPLRAGVNDEAAMADNTAVAMIALVLVLLRYNPLLYRYCRQERLFLLPVLRESLLPLAEEASAKAGLDVLAQITRMLKGEDSSLASPKALAAALEELGASDIPVIIDPALIPRSPSLSGYADRAMLPISEKGTNTRKLNLTDYDFVGPYCEELICVSQRDLWGYIDKTGRTVIPLRYQWASDFAEGRAVVVYDGSHAMIDKRGHEILPAVYESIDGDCHNGIAKAMLDGRYGLYGRDGEELVAPRYEWMGETMDELIPVRENGLYGYIRRNGDMVIDPRFEDANSFDASGHAVVYENGEPHLIDLSGNVVAVAVSHG